MRGLGVGRRVVQTLSILHVLSQQRMYTHQWEQLSRISDAAGSKNQDIDELTAQADRVHVTDSFA